MDTRAFALPLQSPRIPNMRAKHGQTFPEMMIVVAIIAVLAAVIIANLFHARAAAQVSAVKENITSISAAFELYYNDNQTYPLTSNWSAVTPAIFGGNGNTYYNGMPSMHYAGTLERYWANENSSSGTPLPYTIDFEGYFDGSLLQDLTTMGSGYTARPTPGSQYLIMYAPGPGFFAYP